MVWLVRPDDILDLELTFCLVVRAETMDATFLRSAVWVEFRNRLVRFLGSTGGRRSYDEKRLLMPSEGESVRMAGLLRLVVVGVHPEDGVLEVELTPIAADPPAGR